MGWLQRLFGMEKPPNAEVNPAPVADASAASDPDGDPADASAAPAAASVPPERMGLNGEYDQSGLAKRVALAFDNDSEIEDISTVYVAQTGGTVVLKGQAPSQDILNKMVSVASGVSGATSVETNQVTVG